MKRSILLSVLSISLLVLVINLLNPSSIEDDFIELDKWSPLLPETLHKAKERPKQKMSPGELAVLERKLARSESRLQSKSSNVFGKNQPPAESSFANGNITGSWSNVQFYNQGRWGYAYRTVNSAYDKEHDVLYVVSHAKHLWRIDRDGINESNTLWTPMNIKRSFTGFFTGINPDADSFRLLWSSGNRIQYSDDEGKTWTIASNLYFDEKTYTGAVSQANATNNIVVVGKKGSTYRPYYSLDNGSSFMLSSFSISTSNNTVKVVKPHFSDDMYLFVRNSNTSNLTIYKWDYTLNTFNVLHAPTHTFNGLKRAFGTLYNSSTHLYIASSNQIYYSSDEGATWTTTKSDLTGTGDVAPREVDPTNPNTIFRGYLDVAYSTNNGTNFTGFGNRLGWDVHHIKAYEKKDNSTFMFIGDDFGCFTSSTPQDKESYFYLNNTAPTMMCYDSDNSQHYKTFFIATQDRGTRGAPDKDGLTGTNEIRATDGLRTTLSRNEKGLWTWMYFGTIYHKDNFGIKESTRTSHNFTSTNWWASSMVASPNMKEDAVYIASSNKLSKLTYDPYAKKIIRTSHYFDFSTLTSEPLTGFGYSPIDTNKWFVAVKNGDLFYSEDGGLSFEKATMSTKPRANDQSYNYNKNQQTIKGSKLDPNKIFYAGVGEKFMISNDGGKTFTNHSNGLDIWRIRSFDMSPDEKYIFAACATAGMWVYSVDDDMWYEMDDENTPQVDYTNVEYITRDNVVRFSSFGNGILNFKLSNVTETIVHPTDLEITSGTEKDVALSWADNSSNEAGFLVQKSINNKDFETIATLASNSTQFTDNESYGTDELTYRVIAFDASNIESSPSNYVVSSERNMEFPSTTGWELLSVDSARNDHPGTHAFDGDISTYWYTDWSDASSTHPHTIVIDMHETIDIKAFGFYNRQDHPNGRVAQYEFYATTDLNNWGTPISQGTWTSTISEIIEPLPSTTARYLKFIALSSTNEGTNDKITTIAEISVYEEVPEIQTAQPPKAPEVIQGGFLSDTTAEIRWIDASVDEDGFYLEQLINGSFERVQTLGINNTIATISSLSSGTYYTFRLASYNSIGQSEYSSEVKILTSGLSLSIDNITKNEVSVATYPNPFVNEITADLKSFLGAKNISVYSLTGKKVFFKNLFSNSSRQQKIVLQSYLPAGVYILRINGHDGVISKKIVKK